MSRGMDMTFNMIVIAIIVGFVLAILILIFVDQARSFNDRLDQNSCDGFDCDMLIDSGVAGVSVSRPDTVELNAHAVFRVIDTDSRFSTVYVDVTSPDAEALTGRATEQRVHPGSGGGSVHVDTYEHTYEPGVYSYTLIGVGPDGSETVIERGSFRVVERSETGTAPFEVETPERIVSPGTLTAIVRSKDPITGGRLVFASVDDVVSIGLAPTDEMTLAGTSIDGLEPGIYVLEPASSSIVRGDGSSVSIDPRTDVLVRVSDPVSCSASSTCEDDIPFCADRGDGFVCSPVCAAAGERAADERACCADLTLEDGVCTLPGRPIRLVLVPIGVPSERVDAIAQRLEASLREVSPLNACASSRLSVETAQADCVSSCALADRAISSSEYASCLDEVLACGSQVRLDLDRVIGVVGSASMSIDGGEPFTGRAEVGGTRIVIADPGEGDVLHALGDSYGLGHLACGADPNACMGPNFADCGAACTAQGDPGCFADPSASDDLIMSLCERERFGTSGYDVLAGTLAFVRATEVCG